MVSVLASSVLGRGSGQIKDYPIGICCFFAKHAALRRKSKDWLVRNQDNVSEWDDISITIQLSALFKYKSDLIIISLKINLHSPLYS